MSANMNFHPIGGDWEAVLARFNGFSGGNCIGISFTSTGGDYVDLHFHYRKKPFSFLMALKDAINAIPEDEALKLEIAMEERQEEET